MLYFLLLSFFNGNSYQTEYPIKEISSNVVIRFVIYKAAVIRVIIIKKISPTAFLVHGSYGPFLRMNRSGFSKRGNACAVYIYNNNHRRRISYGNRMTGFFTSLFEIKTCTFRITVTIVPYLTLINFR